MPKDVSCPNPGCAHVFPAAAVVGVAALVCPQCGGVFQVKAKNRPVEEVAGPAYQPSRRSAALAWLLAGLILFTSLGLMTAAFYHRAEPPAESGPEPYRSVDHNYALLLPGPPWQRDEILAKRLGGVLAFRREKPDAGVVLVVRQFPKYVPTPAELRDEAVARLRKYPIENLQREDKPDGGTFAGRLAGRFVFQGDVDDGTLISGDVQFLTHQGAAYWLFRWCPAAEVEKASAPLAEIADRFSLLDLHPDWQPPRRTFSGTKAHYTLTADSDRWDKAPYPSENYDPAADLALIGKSQEGAAEPTRAQLLVIILPAGAGDAAARAKAYLLERQKEIYPETTITDLPATDEKTADLKLLSLAVKNTKDRQRFVTLGVVPRKEGPLMLWAECDLARRAVWETNFRKLIESYAPAK